MSESGERFGPHAGLLACTYEAIYDPATNKAIRDGGYIAVLVDYNLSPEVNELAQEVSRTQGEEKFADLVDDLSAELVNNYESICNRLRRSSNV